MLKYNIKISDFGIKQDEIVWGEKYLSPDLSFVSGVTSQEYHLEKTKNISATNTICHTPNSILPIETENVTREGFIVIKGKKYHIENDFEPNYIFLNGKYFYKIDSKFFIDKWLQRTVGLNVEELPYTAHSINDDVLSLDTIVWIENGKVNIDGNIYYYDFNLKGLRRNESDSIMEASSITQCDNIEYFNFSKPSEYKNVTKFVLTKNEEVNKLIENVSFIKYFYYIIFKENYIIVSKNENNNFVCQIPKNLLGSDEEGVVTYSAYTDAYKDDSTTTEEILVKSDSFDTLRENECYFIIEDNRYVITNDILNTNNGSEIGIYIDGDTYNMNVGDIVYFVDTSEFSHQYSAHTDEDRQFILFKSERYDIKANLCDKVKIGDDEYSIEYINGRNINTDCIVNIGENYLPMTISGETSPRFVIQKGLVVSGVSASTAVSMTYPIIEYSGITIDNVDYPIDVINGETTVNIGLPNKYKFVIREIRGSSMLICSPYLSESDFSQDFIKSISQDFCNDVIINQEEMALYANNNIFGKREITKYLAYDEYSGATSSNDYFNLFDNLSLYAPSAYIHIPLSLSTPQGNNLMQDDIVNRDFYEREKKKAINPIIDMEKDVYLPKYFDGKYNGSNTIFKEINEIRLNLHFRTRDLDSWKVNEDYNNAATSGLCNWFVTDFYPYNPKYSTSISSNKKSLLFSSDLIGLLGFNNDDVYYQKSKIAKSFLRLSFYDSVNQNEQILLATSTVFMDEQKLFKKFIDNSRKDLYKNQFLIIEDVFDGTSNYQSKISVKTEFCEKAKTETRCIIDDNHRLGSEFIIKNKYESEHSSEGYYLYMFREYSEKLVPKPIYMKVEFNHAGYGRAIPFIVPMRWKNATENDYKYPDKKLTLDEGDLEELKSGVKLEDSYTQSYIPLYAVYDFKNKEYSYVFDNRYVNIDEEGNLTINLFEIKFANDTTSNEDIQKAITYGKQPIAKINMNASMFDNQEKKCN